mmetsp:Transcript_64861/g.154870  ORF Transcript_64861/g.154870 Transcript_64861/m.154870 type:complete len:210 (+) Transcript_64861:712-1341(+)
MPAPNASHNHTRSGAHTHGLQSESESQNRHINVLQDIISPGCHPAQREEDATQKRQCSDSGVQHSPAISHEVTQAAILQQNECFGAQCRPHEGLTALLPRAQLPFPQPSLRVVQHHALPYACDEQHTGEEEAEATVEQVGAASAHSRCRLRQTPCQWLILYLQAGLAVCSAGFGSLPIALKLLPYRGRCAFRLSPWPDGVHLMKCGAVS